MKNGIAKVTCHTCEQDYNLDTKDVTIICCDHGRDVQTWTFAFLCQECGRRQLGELPTQMLNKLLKVNSPMIVWTPPELHDSDDPPFTNLDLYNFQELLDSTDNIVELVEAV